MIFAALTAAGCEQSPFALDRNTGLGATMAFQQAAADFTGEIRIGVVPTAATITLGAAGDWELIEKSTGAVKMTGTGGSLTVTRQASRGSMMVYRLHVDCYNADALADWLARAHALGYTTWTEYFPLMSCTRARIVNTTGDNSLAARNALRTQLIQQGVAGMTSFWTSVLVEATTGGLLVVGPTASVTVTDAAVLRSSNGPVTIEGVPYRGVAEVLSSSSGSLAGVNQLPLEEYLYGVVPLALDPSTYPSPEALKAHAVAARTNALRQLGKREAQGYDLLGVTDSPDQVYGGVNAEQPLSSQAVDGTTGIVAGYRGVLIDARYSAASGGRTANNEEADDAAPVPYLRGVPDAQRGKSFEHVPSLTVFKAQNPRSLRGFSGGGFETDWSLYHRWTFEWTAAEIRQAISAFAQTDVGTVHEINVLERGPSGRVLRIEYVTDAGTFTSSRDAIRSSLRFVDASGELSNLLSTLFYIEPVEVWGADPGTRFVAWGGGWGHGVGMSQAGAVGMAEKKATYEEILKHYYRGITLVRAY